MTNDEKYMKVINSLGELLATKDMTIEHLDYSLGNIKKKLEAAEAEIEVLKKGVEENE